MRASTATSRSLARRPRLMTTISIGGLYNSMAGVARPPSSQPRASLSSGGAASSDRRAPVTLFSAWRSGSPLFRGFMSMATTVAVAPRILRFSWRPLITQSPRRFC